MEITRHGGACFMETKVAEFRVRNVGLAARCEVCHQDDLFDPATGECRRCRNVPLPVEPSAIGDSPTVSFPEPSRLGRILTVLAATGASILSIPAGFCTFGIINTAINSLVIRAYRDISTSYTDEPIFFWGLVIPVVGIALLLHFWLAVNRIFAPRTRIIAWMIATLYAGSALFLLPRFFSYVSPGAGTAWMVGSFLMTLISCFALIEEIIHRSRHGNH
jgi:hypothetical protein